MQGNQHRPFSNKQQIVHKRLRLLMLEEIQFTGSIALNLSPLKRKLLF